MVYMACDVLSRLKDLDYMVFRIIKVQKVGLL